MRIPIFIKTIEARVGKDSGRAYWSVETLDHGKISVFDKAIVTKLVERQAKGQIAEVEIVENKGFKNIQEFYDVPAGEQVPTTNGSIIPVPKTKTNGHQAMYTSYAKDVFIALMNDYSKSLSFAELMKKSIEVVKQARDAFK